MKFSYNHLKKKYSQGLLLADMRRFEKVWNNGRHALAWSLPLASVLAMVPTAAQAQVAAIFDWGTGVADEEIDFPAGTTANLFTNVDGSGVDVQITVVGADTTNTNANLVLGDSDFVSPSQPDETLFVGITGEVGAQATVTIQFFQTGTTTPVDVTLTSFPLFDVDTLFEETPGVVSWQDQVTVSASSGGAAVAGIAAGGEAPPEGIFNQEDVGPTSVTITGVNTTVGLPNAIDNITTNANSPRIPGLTNTTTTGTFDGGNVTVNIPAPADTITIELANGPGTEDFDPHAIAIGDISFTAPTPEAPAIGVSKQALSTTTLPSGNFEVVYETTVENLGDVDLNGVQLVEDLDGTFGAGAFTVTAAPTNTGGVALLPNGVFTGTGAGDTNILAAGQTLAVGDSSTFQFTVEIDNTQVVTPGTFENQIEASGTSPGGIPVDDLSDDGVETDENPGDGSPGDGLGEDDPTPVVLPPVENPIIGVSKQVVSAITQPDGDFEVVYETTVENLGDVTLTSVQLVEDLDGTFGDGAFTVTAAPINTGGVALAPNATFDADGPTGATAGDTNILAAGQTLLVGASSTFQFTVEIESDLVTTPGTFNNQIEASGISPAGANVDDLSDDGVETDENPGDGSPGDGPGEDDETPLVLPPINPAIGVSKQVVSSTIQPDGDFEIVYETTVTNLGDVVLNDVQLTEDLDPTFGEGSFTVTGAPTFAPLGVAGEVELVPNAGFDGDAPNGTPGDTNILAAGQTLQIGESSTFQFTVEVDSASPTLGPVPGTFENQIEAIGTPPLGAPVTDLSNDGTEADPNPGDGQLGDGPGEDTPTPVTLPPVPAAIGVSKQVISAITQPDGDFEVVYETTVVNLGSVELADVQLTEDLDPTFGEGSFIILEAPTFTALGLAGEVELIPNAAFDGDEPDGTPGDTNILAAGQTLGVGENSTFQFTVEIDSDSPTLGPIPGTFENQIEAVGTPPVGPAVTDLSNNGTDADPDPTDGAPGNGPTENVPTPVVLPPTPVIGVAKDVVSIALEPTGTFGADTVQVIYSVVVANVGTVPLEQVQLDEDFGPVFGAGTFQVVSLTPTGGATTVTADPGFDGAVDTTLLADAAGVPTGTLAVGASSTFELVVDVNAADPNLTPPLPGPFDNQIEANAVDADGNTTSDLSDSGTEVDPDGDGNPNETNGQPADPDNPEDDGNENTPTRVTFEPDLDVVKRITAVTRNGVELAIPNIEAFNDEPGETSDNALFDLTNGTSPLGLVDIPTALQSGDLVEYTITFFNAGLGTAENLEFCDELQPPSILQVGSLEFAQPVAGGTPLTFSTTGPLSPRAPLSPLEPICLSAPGTFPSGVPAGGLGTGAGGGVVVGGPTSGLNLDAGEVGAFRFEILIP